MSKTYQVHVKTVGQMDALMSHYLSKGYREHGPCSIEERLAEFPVVVLYTKDKMIGGNRTTASHPNFITIPFDQAFDLPVKKESVEFCASAVNWKVEKNTCICNFDKALGDRAFMFDPERLIAQLQSALDELDND